jgi:hypothetical protein
VVCKGGFPYDVEDGPRNVGLLVCTHAADSPTFTPFSQHEKNHILIYTADKSL